MKIKDERVISRTEYADFMDTTYKDRKNRTKHWNWVKRKDEQSIIVVVATVGDKLVAINQFRVPIKKTVWELPSGIFEKDELPEVAGARELLEETGLSIKEIIGKVTPPLYNSPGITDEIIHYIFVEAEGELSTKGAEDTEQIKPALLSRTDVFDILKNEKNAIAAKTYLIFKRFAEEGIIT